MGAEGDEAWSETEKEVFDWVRNSYFPGVHALMDGNRTYLNQGITWSIGILTAVIIFGFNYIAPFQEVKAHGGGATGRSFAAILRNITDGDILLLTAVLSLSCAFVSNFMSRSTKGYLNLMRYVGLYSKCLALCASTRSISRNEFGALTELIKQYDEDFCPPLRFSTVSKKMLSELGYGLFFAVLAGLYGVVIALWYDAQSTLCSSYFWGVLAAGPVWLAVELHFLKGSNYFQFRDYPVQDWSEARRRK